jgi:hypothetical protein
MSNSFLGENAAVPTESSGERPRRHAIERASRRFVEDDAMIQHERAIKF